LPSSWTTTNDVGGIVCIARLRNVRYSDGVYCGHKIFSTKRRAGITFGDGISWEEARAIVARKHGL